MSIFDNVSRKPITPELKLMVSLRYGIPEDTPEYRNRLPDAVVENVWKQLGSRHNIQTLEEKRMVIGLLILNGRTIDLVTEALYEYHILLG